MGTIVERDCKSFRTGDEDHDGGPTVGWRPANVADVRALSELDRLCFGRLAWPVEAWWDVVLEPAWTTIVFEVGGTPIAASVSLIGSPVSTLASIAVHPRWRRVGLGRQLLLDSVNRARRAHARWLSLEVDACNDAARELYREEGFGVARRFLEDGRRRVEMVRRLGGNRGR
jgi:ribosomal-protein-alanine N-acetyltransferase